jgi:hypothetical protein
MEKPYVIVLQEEQLMRAVGRVCTGYSLPPPTPHPLSGGSECALSEKQRLPPCRQGLPSTEGHTGTYREAGHPLNFKCSWSHGSRGNIAAPGEGAGVPALNTLHESSVGD